MPSDTVYRREIESLHEFFVRWYTGAAERDDIDRLEGALAPTFEMVTPGGNRREYDAVVAGISGRYDTRDPGAFDIEIRNVETRYEHGEHALVRYEEWQETPTETTGRLSTVLFAAAADAPGDVRWLDLQETWLDGPDGNE